MSDEQNEPAKQSNEKLKYPQVSYVEFLRDEPSVSSSQSYGPF